MSNQNLLCGRTVLHLCVFLGRVLVTVLRLVGQLVPDLSVDPQGAGQRQPGAGAGDPAAQGAGDGAERPLQDGYFFQARCAERVVAVEEPRDAVAAGVFAAADDALQILVWKHGARSQRQEDPFSTKALQRRK